MKKVLALFALSFALLACTTPPDFHVDLSVTHSEVSEDSSTTTETLVIDGYEGTYHWVYSGYSPDENMDTDREYDFTLTDEDLQSLTLLIRENGLMIQREDTVNTGEPWSAFEVSWNNSMGGQTASGHVTGEPSSWEDWNASEPSSITDESLYAVEQVMDFVKEFE